MKISNLIRLLFLASVVPMLAASCAKPPAQALPNIVLIIADDMAWDDSGPYGNEKVRTPNLDRLAREGMRFENAFLTASSCSPSRASIITGRYPHATDAEQLHWPLPAQQVTFVEHLRRAGYWTAAAGKWHLGNEVRDRFDEVREADPSQFQLPAGDDAEKGKFAGSGSSDVKSGCDQWVPLLRARPRGKPFFLWLAALDPHRDYDEAIIPEPHRPEDVVVPPYLPDAPETRKDLALYYDEISRLDRFVGEVLAELESQGVADNTLVLFISDNGRPFPRAKTTVYDSGIKTPWIVRWPGRVRAGTTSAGLVSSVDIAPTFLEIAGLKPLPEFQGRSFAPLLGNPQARIQDYVFAERNWHDFEDRIRAVRSTRYKYIRNYYPDLAGTPPADAVRSPTYTAMRRLRDERKLTPEQMVPFVAPRPEEELYDMQADPHELRNLAGDPALGSTLDEMRQALREWEERTQDLAPAVRTRDEFDRETGLPLPDRVRPRPSKKQSGVGPR